MTTKAWRKWFAWFPVIVESDANAREDVGFLRWCWETTGWLRYVERRWARCNLHDWDDPPGMCCCEWRYRNRDAIRNAEQEIDETARFLEKADVR